MRILEKTFKAPCFLFQMSAECGTHALNQCWREILSVCRTRTHRAHSRYTWFCLHMRDVDDRYCTVRSCSLTHAPVQCVSVCFIELDGQPTCWQIVFVDVFIDAIFTFLVTAHSTHQSSAERDIKQKHFFSTTYSPSFYRQFLVNRWHFWWSRPSNHRIRIRGHCAGAR